MNREDIARLLGGYATGTLTPEEQQALFAAALEDQALFDELAREQALRDVLSEPGARAQLLAALEDPPRWHQRFGTWMLRPAALTAAAACLLILGAVAVWRPWRGNEPGKQTEVATALPREVPPVSSPPVAEDKEERAPLLAKDATKPKATPVPHAPFVAASPAHPALKKELMAEESAAPVAADRQLDQPVGIAGHAMLPAASPPPPAPKPASADTIGELVIAARDAAQLADNMRGVETPSGGSAGAIGAVSSKRSQPANAVSVNAGGNAQQRYYASEGLGAVKTSARTQNLIESPQAQGSQSAPLGIKWSILRRDTSGEFEVVNPEDLRAGDTVELRLTANQSCQLSIFDNTDGKLLPFLAKHVEAGETVDTPPLTPGGKGLRELMVALARRGSVAGIVAGAQPAQLREGQQSQINRGERATYTVGPAGAQQVVLSIALNYR